MFFDSTLVIIWLSCPTHLCLHILLIKHLQCWIQAQFNSLTLTQFHPQRSFFHKTVTATGILNLHDDLLSCWGEGGRVQTQPIMGPQYCCGMHLGRCLQLQIAFTHSQGNLRITICFPHSSIITQKW